MSTTATGSESLYQHSACALNKRVKSDEEDAQVGRSVQWKEMSSLHEKRLVIMNRERSRRVYHEKQCQLNDNIRLLSHCLQVGNSIKSGRQRFENDASLNNSRLFALKKPNRNLAFQSGKIASSSSPKYNLGFKVCLADDSISASAGKVSAIQSAYTVNFTASSSVSSVSPSGERRSNSTATHEVPNFA